MSSTHRTSFNRSGKINIEPIEAISLAAAFLLIVALVYPHVQRGVWYDHRRFVRTLLSSGCIQGMDCPLVWDSQSGFFYLDSIESGDVAARLEGSIEEPMHDLSDQEGDFEELALTCDKDNPCRIYAYWDPADASCTVEVCYVFNSGEEEPVCYTTQYQSCF